MRMYIPAYSPFGLIMSELSQNVANCDKPKEKPKLFCWKRQMVSEKAYEQRLKQQKMAKNIWKNKVDNTTEDESNLKTVVTNETNKLVGGRRITQFYIVLLWSS